MMRAPSSHRGTFVASCAVGFAITSVACASSTPAPASPTDRIACIHRARCGACHQRVEPGERSRDALESALARHHTRVRLSDADWHSMIDYLATSVPR